MEDAKQALDWVQILNIRGTTFRELSDVQKQQINRASALDLMLEQMSMIKRLIFIHNEQYHLDFKAQLYSEVFLVSMF